MNLIKGNRDKLYVPIYYLLFISKKVESNANDILQNRKLEF